MEFILKYAFTVHLRTHTEGKTNNATIVTKMDNLKVMSVLTK